MSSAGLLKYGVLVFGLSLGLLDFSEEAQSCASHGDAVSAQAMKKFKQDRLKHHSHSPTRKTAAQSDVPPPLPNPSGSGSLSPWGGTDANRWRPEAVLANAFSQALNQAWSLPDVADVTVSVPTHFSDSGYHPYGDGQSNTKVEFNASWNFPRPQVVATLVKFKNGKFKVLFRMDRALQRVASAPVPQKVEISWNPQGNAQKISLSLRREASGDYLAEWNDLPADNEWGNGFKTKSFLVRIQPSFDDWFPVSFKMPVKTANDLISRTRPEKQKFKGAMNGLKLVDADGKYQDPLLIAQRSRSSGKTPFDVLMDQHFPNGYNQTFYNPQNIHAEYGQGGTVTGVGQGWTWVAEDKQSRPFKIMYTCFEKRQPSAEASARNGGVTSGGGWHAINNRTPNVDADVPETGAAEIIVNSLESGPLMVSAGYSQILARSGALPNGVNLSYGLDGVAIARWLKPGEAFVTTANNSQQNHHWFFFSQAQEVCSEEWVGQCSVDFPCE